MTKTYYFRNTTSHVGSVGISNRDLETTTGTSTTESSFAGNSPDWWDWYSANSEPNLTDWPNGTYTWYLVVSTANSIVELTSVRLIRMNSSRSSILASTTNTVNITLSSVQTYSGTIDWSSGQNPGGRSSSDIFAIEYIFTRISGHGNQEVVFKVNGPSDSRVDTPLEAAAGIPQNILIVWEET